MIKHILFIGFLLAACVSCASQAVQQTGLTCLEADMRFADNHQINYQQDGRSILLAVDMFDGESFYQVWVIEDTGVRGGVITIPDIVSCYALISSDGLEWERFGVYRSSNRYIVRNDIESATRREVVIRREIHGTYIGTPGELPEVFYPRPGSGPAVEEYTLYHLSIEEGQLVVEREERCDPLSLESNSMEVAYQQALSLHQNILLPNSMARPEGFDVALYIESLEIGRDELIEEFNHDEGLEYLFERREVSDDLIELDFIAYVLENWYEE